MTIVNITVCYSTARVCSKSLALGKKIFKPSNQFKYISSIGCVPVTVLSTRVGWGIGLGTERITNAVCVFKFGR